MKIYIDEPIVWARACFLEGFEIVELKGGRMDANQPVTVKEIIATVRELAKERPGTGYTPARLGGHGTRCSYRHGVCSDGTTGCIFGQALQMLGVDTEEFDRPLAVSILDVIRRLDPENDRTKPAWWCAAVQSNQDRGEKWGEAVRLADEHYPLNR